MISSTLRRLGRKTIGTSSSYSRQSRSIARSMGAVRVTMMKRRPMRAKYGSHMPT